MERRDASAEAVELLKQHRRFTARLARRVGRFDAEDLASEALARSLGQPPADGRREPWLERILRNLVVDRARRSRSATIHAAELSRAASMRAMPSPEDQLLSDERRRAVEAALPEIPSGLREAVVSRFYEERNYDDVAAAGGISPATARTRVHRALAALRMSLGRLRGLAPLPSLFGTHSFSATTAMLPGVLGAALLVPALTLPVVPARPPARVPSETVIAQVSPHPRPDSFARAPAIDNDAQLDVAPPAAAADRRPARGAGTAAATPQVVHRNPPPPATDSTSTAEPPAVRRYNYEEDVVEGDIARPDGADVNGGPATAKHPSLIEIPREFVREIGKMLEDM